MNKRPLDGIRVADFSWFGAGPIAGNILASFGAEVVRVESETKIDTLRIVQPVALNADGTQKTGSYNTSGYFNNFNAGKLSFTVNLNTEKGQEVGYRLIEKSDVFLSNFTPRVLEKWNLLYEQIRQVNPRIIAAYAPMQGMWGPQKDFLGFGAVLTPLVGISEMSGYPDREPIGVGTNYPDYVINPGHTVTAILAAIRHRNRTGQGQCVELAQLESVVNVLGPAVAEYLANGTNSTRMGNHHLLYTPHGCFRCADDESSVGSPDRWIVIACRDDAEFLALADVMGQPTLASDPRFSTQPARKANEDELESLISAWTAGRVAEETVDLLQSRAIPSGLVANAQDILDKDAHMKARAYYQYLDHPETGVAAYDGAVPRLSKTPGYHAAPAPLMGEHTMDVCERILGLSTDEIADLLADGILV